MSGNDAETERPVLPAAPEIANPAPLGLCGFALTTFVLSAHNAGLIAKPGIVIGLALFYGGIVQVLAGMWEFKTGNTFGATAFSSYGAFWLAVAASLQLHLIPADDPNAFAFFLLSWTIFTAIMFLASFRTSVVLIVLFAFLLTTFAVLTGAAFGHKELGPIGGYLGLATAAIAWYAALAGLLAAGNSPIKLPVGTIR